MNLVPSYYEVLKVEMYVGSWKIKFLKFKLDTFSQFNFF